MVWCGLLAVAGASASAAEGLAGRVLCGYQGWFAAEGDGGGVGWSHWRSSEESVPVANQVRVDLLPDVSELSPDERFPLGIVDAAGRPVEVFSSYREPTVRRHFRWMREYGIDGVFVQRFAAAVADPNKRAFHDTVLQHCRTAAEQERRVYAVMYDLTGLAAGRVGDVLADWRALRRSGVGHDAAALQIDGRPLVAVWGIGFAKDRAYSLAECRDLVAALKADGCAVLIGVPSGWRTGVRDAVADPLLLEIAASADVVSPWTVGRYRSPVEVSRHAASTWAPDMTWCRERGIEYLPVVFPGFSWKNLKGGPLDQISRLRGQFFQQQIVDATSLGAQSLYVAMFDECDEGTAIFKCAEPPRGLEDRFVGFDGMRSDHYLRLAGNARRRLQTKAPRPK